VLDELLPAACHVMEQYANNPLESDHGRLKARVRPMRGLKRLRSARVISTGHAFIQNLRRDHYELGVDTTRNDSSRRRSPNSPSPFDHSPRRLATPASRQRNSALIRNEIGTVRSLSFGRAIYPLR
jgi:hypothetical protein